MLICPYCGEQEKFKRTVYGSRNYSETEVIDKNEDIIDWENYEDGDTYNHEYEPAVCYTCETNADNLSEKDLILFIWKHRDKMGDWSEDELPEEERDNSIIKETITSNI